MFSGGNATIYVANMDAAIHFYAERLGLKLTNRFGERWATVTAVPSHWTTADVGAGLVLGLHPPSPKYPAPGTRGAVMFGLETYALLEDVVARLAERDVHMAGDIVAFEAGKAVALEDPDGNPIYLWEITRNMVPETDLGPEEDSPADPASAMFSGGHATVYVSSMDAAVRFYTEVLGLKLTNRFDNHWATVEAGRSLVIGLHPTSANYPPPGTKGAVMLGLQVDEPIQTLVSRLVERGVRVHGDRAGAGPRNAVDIEDLDGNVISLSETNAMPVRDELAHAGAAPRD